MHNLALMFFVEAGSPQLSVSHAVVSVRKTEPVSLLVQKDGQEAASGQDLLFEAVAQRLPSGFRHSNPAIRIDGNGQHRSHTPGLGLVVTALPLKGHKAPVLPEGEKSSILDRRLAYRLVSRDTPDFNSASYRSYAEPTSLSIEQCWMQLRHPGTSLGCVSVMTPCDESVRTPVLRAGAPF
ncbi:hypothetical protein MHYP_G00225640 [Metynnis hypsauchen]